MWISVCYHTPDKQSRASLLPYRSNCTPLSPITIIYQVEIDLEEVVNLFSTKHPWRLEFGTILRD